MKYHVILKFLAIILCAAMLLTGAAGIVGIAVFASLDLYERSVDDVQLEYDMLTAESYAWGLVFRYTSTELGGCPEELVRAFHNYEALEQAIARGQLSYTLRDWDGNEVESLQADTGGGAAFTIPVETGHYLQLLEEVTPAVPEAEATVPEASPEKDAPEAVPEQTGEATQPGEPAGPEETTGPADSAETAETEETTGPAQQEEQPQETSEPVEPTEETLETSEPVEPTEETLETSEPVEPTEETPETSGPTEAPPATEPVIQSYDSTEPPSDHFSYTYYDPRLGSSREFLLRHETAPGFVVELILAPELLEDQQAWELLRLLWGRRMDLFWITGVSLLLFAALAVYLCCAAGRKPRQPEIRAGGLNRLPLDLYAGLGTLGVTGLAVLAYEVSEYIYRQDLMAAVYVVAGAGYVCAVLIVCFCFAAAAQFKTPGGFWWRGSLCGRCCKLIVFLWNLAIRILAWMFDKLTIFLRWSQAKLLPLGIRLLKALWKLLRFFLEEFRKLSARLWKLLCRICRFCWSKLARFIALLPLSWQWLMAGFVMIFVLVMTVNARSALGVLLGICAALAMVLYGASVFGTLLESARRMRRGDLETKVDDQFFVGCFRDFAQELNGLADVSAVAAQKQLKSERMKTELITNVSHDIKTPLTSIINYVDLLEKPHTPQEQEQYLEVLHRQSQRLKKLIDDLMEMSKASTGNLAVDIETVDAAEAVNQALGEFSDKLEAASLHPVFKHPDAPVLILADGRLVWRVMSNILSNAVKYALPGTRLYVDLQSEESTVTLSLKNISREELNVEADELMERFVRGDASRNTEGSGLGLNIAKSLMELQKGQLQLLIDGDLFKVTLVFQKA